MTCKHKTFIFKCEYISLYCCLRSYDFDWDIDLYKNPSKYIVNEICQEITPEAEAQLLQAGTTLSASFLFPPLICLEVANLVPLSFHFLFVHNKGKNWLMRKSLGPFAQ